MLTLFAMYDGLDTQGSTLMIAVGANLVLGIVVGMLGARFARPGPTDTLPWAGLGGFLLALFVLYPLLTFAFDTAVMNRGVYVGSAVVQPTFQGKTNYRMEPMSIQLVAEETITVGQPAVVEAPSPSKSYSVVFEDDGQTGYLYGLDFSRPDNPIVDAMHIYDVKQVMDRAKPSVVQLVWSKDGLRAALLINRYPHAVFDFEDKRGYCRTGFPLGNNKWTQHDHSWDYRVMELFK